MDIPILYILYKCNHTCDLCAWLLSLSIMISCFIHIAWIKGMWAVRQVPCWENICKQAKLYVLSGFFKQVHFQHLGVESSPTPCLNALHLDITIGKPKMSIVIPRSLELQNSFPCQKVLRVPILWRRMFQPAGWATPGKWPGFQDLRFLTLLGEVVQDDSQSPFIPTLHFYHYRKCLGSSNNPH